MQLTRKIIVIIGVALTASAAPARSQATSHRPSGEAVRAEVDRQRNLHVTPDIGVVRESQTICAGQLPAGWIKTDDAWNPTTCGNPTSIVYNVWTITRYSNQPVGSSMTACAGAVPAGWVMINSWWNPTTCSHPTSIVNNVMSIKWLN